MSSSLGPARGRAARPGCPEPRAGRANGNDHHNRKEHNIIRPTDQIWKAWTFGKMWRNLWTPARRVFRESLAKTGPGRPAGAAVPVQRRAERPGRSHAGRHPPGPRPFWRGPRALRVAGGHLPPAIKFEVVKPGSRWSTVVVTGLPVGHGSGGSTSESCAKMGR
jgi:hypothetical protein